MRAYYYEEEYQRGPSYIMPLIVLNIIVFVLGQDQLQILGGDYSYKVTEFLKFHPYPATYQFQLWRYITYMFLHQGVTHILYNMWGLYIFGRPLERLLGGTRFLILYFLSGIIGALVWLLFNFGSAWHLILGVGNEAQLCSTHAQFDALKALYPHLQILGTAGGLVGASGAIFGLIVATAMAAPKARIALLFPPIVITMKTFALVYMGLELLLSFNTHSSIAHLAHLGGGLGGFIFYSHLKNNPSDQW